MPGTEKGYKKVGKCKACGKIVDASELELCGVCVACWRKGDRRAPWRGRKCGRFRCPHYMDHRCCADCKLWVRCKEACMNDPSRCRLEMRCPDGHQEEGEA